MAMVIFVCIYLLIAGSATDSDEELLEAALAAEARSIILNTQFPPGDEIPPNLFDDEEDEDKDGYELSAPLTGFKGKIPFLEHF